MLSNFAAVDLFAMPSLTNGEARAHRVPCVMATDQTLRGYGRIVRDFATDRVTIVTWPQPGRRPIVPGHCDGTFGIHIDPSVWHQPVFPLGPSAVFVDKQGRVHACVAVDFVGEFGCYLEVPLLAPG